MRVGLQVHESKVHEIFESSFMESWIPMNTDQTSTNAAQMSPRYQCDSPRPTSPSYECDSPQLTSPSYMPSPAYVKKSPITFKDTIEYIILN